MRIIGAEFSYAELFMIEMAIDEVMYRVNDTNNTTYQKYSLLDQKIYQLRKSAEKEE